MDPSEAPKCDVAPATASAYLDLNYWDRRFAQEEHYEWFKDYSHFRHLILQYIKPNFNLCAIDYVLEVGCGNSQVCEELYRDEITDLTCIDLSSIAEKMKLRLLSKSYKDTFVLASEQVFGVFLLGCLFFLEERVDPCKTLPLLPNRRVEF
ncbi:hypothetical protein ACS0TY_009728 [Phlomoides rotata]